MLKQKKVGAASQVQTPVTLNDDIEDTDDEEEEEDDELEKAARLREEKRRNEEGRSRSKEGGGRGEGRSRSQGGGGRSKEKEICKAFKFGGKCPHGMSGLKKHDRWENCHKSHPKVCSKLLDLQLPHL